MAHDEGLAERIRTALLCLRCNFTERKMFGGVTFMVSGHMACGVLKTELIVKIPREETVAALERPHVRAFDFTGKPMKGMVCVSPLGTDDQEALDGWVERGVKFAQSQAPKTAKGRVVAS